MPNCQTKCVSKANLQHALRWAKVRVCQKRPYRENSCLNLPRTFAPVRCEIGTDGLLKDKVCRPIASERLRDGPADQSGHKRRYRRVSSEKKRTATLVGKAKGELPMVPVFNTHWPNPYGEESLEFKSSPEGRTFQRFKPTHPKYPLSTPHEESSSSGLTQQQSKYCSRFGYPVFVRPLNPVRSLALRQGSPNRIRPPGCDKDEDERSVMSSKHSKVTSSQQFIDCVSASSSDAVIKLLTDAVIKLLTGCNLMTLVTASVFASSSDCVSATKRHR